MGSSLSRGLLRNCVKTAVNRSSDTGQRPGLHPSRTPPIVHLRGRETPPPGGPLSTFVCPTVWDSCLRTTGHFAAHARRSRRGRREHLGAVWIVMVIDSTPLVMCRWVRSLCWDEHDGAGREQTGRGVVESPRPSRCSGGSELIGAPSRAVGLFGRVVWAHETISLTELSPRGDMSDVRQGRSGGVRKGLALALVVTTVFVSICGFVLAALNGAAASAILNLSERWRSR